MSDKDATARTRLLLTARASNGTQLVVNNEYDQRIMQKMVEEGLFRYSNDMFSKGYWWTKAGKRAAEAAWQQIPVQRFETRYRDHPQVSIGLNGYKQEVCHVIWPKGVRGSELWVREGLDGRWLVDHPNGGSNVPFESADKAIEWALEQVGAPRK